MGIPSFYRHLCKRFPKLITKGVGSKPEWLCLDFNCAMYFVLRTMRPFDAEKKGKWETELCDGIAKYMGELIELEGPTKGAYISCDGAVCAAKRRQQRLRRFKGPWAAAMEAQVTGRPLASGPGSGWDQNALTPGSAFMAQLGETLTAAGRGLQTKLGIPVTVSTTKEAGEGEHKLMAHMRLVKPVSCTIYGLDADLILLAMLLGVDTGANVRLMREAQEFEGSGSGSDSGSGWRSLDVSGLAAAMIPAVSSEKIRDFVATMTLLGNDFLPRSLTHTVRDDGIPGLIATLQRDVWTPGLRIVGEDGALQRQGLLAVLQVWAANEERDLVVAALSARKASRYPPGIGANPEETALKEWNAQPARWASICKILDTHDQNRLARGWRGIYESWHPGSAAAYVQGVAWVWDYYSGRVVDQGWYFDEHLPPRWETVVAFLLGAKATAVPPPPVTYPTPLPDWLHLLAVLPAESVERLLPAKVARLMGTAPWYWPSSWSIFDVGKTQLWECEPVIPIIPETVLRSWISTTVV